MMTLLLVSDGDTAPVLEWLRRKAAGGKIERRALARITAEQLRDDVDGLSPASRASYLTTAVPETRCRLHRVYSFLCEFRLFLWVVGLNVEKGVAPSTVDLCRRFLETWPADGVAGVPAPRLAALMARPVSARMWAVRWRRRWGIRHGKPRIRTTVGEPEVCDKVAR
ncbi:MAG: hypothetical protein GY769_00010 [bacterium]|nr:hypothetical protein [bacterium]